MNLFNRKSEPEPEQITGTEALRQRLKNYVCTRSLADSGAETKEARSIPVRAGDGECTRD